MTCNSCFSSLIRISWMVFLSMDIKVAFQTYLEFWTVLVVKQRTTKLYIDYVTLKAKPHRKLQVG